MPKIDLVFRREEADLIFVEAEIDGESISVGRWRKQGGLDVLELDICDQGAAMPKKALPSASYGTFTPAPKPSSPPGKLQAPPLPAGKVSAVILYRSGNALSTELFDSPDQAVAWVSEQDLSEAKTVKVDIG